MMRAYLDLSKKEKRLFREALYNVYGSKFGLLFFSFKSFSEKHKSTGCREDISIEELKAIRRALQRTNKLAFWKNKCIVQTFAGRKMLNKRNIHSSAYLGLRKSDINDSLNAHSWLVTNEFQVVPKEMEYTELYTF